MKTEPGTPAQTAGINSATRTAGVFALSAGSVARWATRISRLMGCVTIAKARWKMNLNELTPLTECPPIGTKCVVIATEFVDDYGVKIGDIVKINEKSLIGFFLNMSI